MQKVLLAVIAASIVTIGLTVNYSSATHQPADKTQGSANSIEEVGEGDGVTLLEETMRVSSTSDLILSTTAECSILTSLNTSGGPNEATESDGAFGQVEMWIEVDGNPVPVQSVGAPNDDGSVVFCNRAYQRTVTDNEQDEDATPDPAGVRDGIDSEDDFIRTRNANGFNWMAFDAGTTYDTLPPNNIVTVELKGRFTRAAQENGTPDANPRCADREDANGDPIPGEDADGALVKYTDTCAEAFVGNRSLIVEAVHASNHEQTAPVTDGE